LKSPKPPSFPYSRRICFVGYEEKIRDGVITTEGVKVIGIEVAVGAGVMVGVDAAISVGATVSVGTTLAAGTQETKIIATSKTVTMFLIFIDTFLCKELPNGLRYLRWGGDGEAVQPEKG